VKTKWRGSSFLTSALAFSFTKGRKYVWVTSGVFGPKNSQLQTVSFANISDMEAMSLNVIYEKVRVGDVQVVCICHYVCLVG
jgi:hypothetical protein